MFRRIKSAVSAAFYIHHHKPDFCELFVICGGRLVFLRGENDKGTMEDDQGVIVAKLREKASFKGWLAKIFNETSASSPVELQQMPTPPLTHKTVGNAMSKKLKITSSICYP